VVGIQDSRVIATGTTRRLGRFVQLRDVYGNTYTYAKLAVTGRERHPQHTARVDAASGKRRLFANPARTRTIRRPLRVGSKVVAGTILGRVGKTQKHVASHLLFEIRPAGKGAPRIDPKPILDGWKLARWVAAPCNSERWGIARRTLGPRA
jgi:hypothetical protein